MITTIENNHYYFVRNLYEYFYFIEYNNIIKERHFVKNSLYDIKNALDLNKYFNLVNKKTFKYLLVLNNININILINNNLLSKKILYRKIYIKNYYIRSLKLLTSNKNITIRHIIPYAPATCIKIYEKEHVI